LQTTTRTTTTTTITDSTIEPTDRTSPGTPATCDLVRRAQGGSLPAFAALVDRYEAGLFNFLLRRVGIRADAEDLTQETFVRAWQKIAGYRSRWQFTTWLYTIASRLAWTHLKRRRPHQHIGHELPDPRLDDPAAAAVRREQHGRVWQVAERVLSPMQLSALWLRYADDLGNRDIARILGMTSVGVRVMLFRAREKLGDALAEDQVEERKDITDRLPAPGSARPVTGGARW
jgi:RNA polymerase sigma-70 factor (ECF subfamily)